MDTETLKIMPILDLVVMRKAMKDFGDDISAIDAEFKRRELEPLTSKENK